MPGDAYHFIPSNDAELSVWTVNFEEKIPILAPVLAIPAEKVTEVQTISTTIRDGVDKHAIKKQEYLESVAYKKLLRQREVKALVSLAIAIKRMPGYTENIGRELGIIRKSPTPTLRTQIKPRLKLNVEKGYVAIAFNKQKQTGITIYSRLKGTNGWETLVSGATVSPFLDTRTLQTPANAEVREYMARYWDNATEIGLESDIVFTLFGG